MVGFSASANQHYQRMKQDLFDNLINPPIFLSSFSEPNEEEKVDLMEKKYGVTTSVNGTIKYKTYEEAEKIAKQYTSANGQEYVIVQAVAATMTPVPSIEVVKL